MDEVTNVVIEEPAPQLEEAAANGTGRKEASQEPVLAPLADRLARGLASTLVVAIQDLEDHIAAETGRVGDRLGQRLEALQASIQDLTQAVSEQGAVCLSLREECQQLAAATASLKLSETRHEAELAALRTEARDFSSTVAERIDALSIELGLRQEEIAVVKSDASNVASKVDALVERLDGQAEAIRSLYASSTEREGALDQLMDGLTKLRASRSQFPTEL